MCCGRRFLAGVLSVALLYHLVARSWGPIAGIVAGLALAITPITVVTDRNNTIDSLLILTLLLAAWAVILAAERGHVRFLYSAPYWSAWVSTSRCCRHTW